MSDIKIEVHYILTIQEEHVAKVLKYAREYGYGYGEDPGPKEIIRRLVIGEGTDVFSPCNEDIPIEMERKK